MDGKTDAVKSVYNANRTSLTEVACEGRDTTKQKKVSWKTTMIDRPTPNVALPIPILQTIRRRPGRPKKIRLDPLTPVAQMPVRGRPRRQLGNLTSGPLDTPSTSYFAVLRPERTYERRPVTFPTLRPELSKRVLEEAEDQNRGSTMETTESRSKPTTLGTSHMLSPVIDFPGPRIPPKAPATPEVSGTMGLLCSQLDKLQKAAKSGNEGALLLLEQYKAFGKKRHHFSERMLLKCSLWRARSCYSYHCARRTQLFTLPGRTTLHRYGQLGSNS